MTVVDVLLKIAERTLKPGDPDIIFMHWLKANGGRLQEATRELGIEVAEGPDFLRRLRAAVVPRLTGRPAPEVKSHAERWQEVLDRARSKEVGL
ncbi:MAG: hypothetical protein C4551_10140 [Bacillota bacterium]|nr:MAG: hypothetical protein C4551_10140 [Bacillota bacterium]